MHNQADMKRCPFYTYCNSPKCWDRQTLANSIDPDQMPQNLASDLHLHCQPLIQQYKRCSKLDLFRF